MTLNITATVTVTDFIEAPVCESCSDYVDFPDNKLIQIDDGSIHEGTWVHYGNHEERCPGQDDDDTEDVAEPTRTRDGKWFVVAFDSSGSEVIGSRSARPAVVDSTAVAAS